MTAEDSPLTDVSDMVWVHDCFRRGLAEARGQLGFIADGDTQRATRFADYISELLWLLHAHHGGEDELIYPLLRERAPEEDALMDRMDEQHASVESGLHAAERAAAAYRETGSVVDARALAEACESLLSGLSPHLAEEEADLLPVAARCLSQEEWGQLPGHAMGSYSGDRIWLPFGLATEAFPAAVLDAILDGPSPLGPMWRDGGNVAFAEEMLLIRDPEAWADR